jgi:hypothetical protein
MKSPHLSAQEKQANIQELMSLGTNALLNAAASTSANSNGMELDDRHRNTAVDGGKSKNDDQGMLTDQLGDQKPPAATKVAPPLSSNDLTTARVPTPPSAGWIQFIEKTPRCAGAEGIRESSVFNRHASSSSDLSVPRCMKRLFKELDALKEDLPSDSTCSIWLRFDEGTLLRIILIGCHSTNLTLFAVGQ